MSIVELFSKRQKKLRGETLDVYQYDHLPEAFRIQVIHIWKDAIGGTQHRRSVETYKRIYDLLCREYGVFKLNESDYPDNLLAGLANFLLCTNEIEKALDVVELSFRVISKVCSKYDYRMDADVTMTPESAINELNHRFLEHGIGFQFISDAIIRMDSQIIHSEVIKPAITLLHREDYKGANDEFLKAHEHYRHGRYKECLNECLKSFESTLKTICKQKKWSHKETDTANTLINICFHNDLVPKFLQSEFSALRTTLECGIPTTRNKMSGHGQGDSIITVPSHLASYLLHMTGAAIIFLVESATNSR